MEFVSNVLGSSSGSNDGCEEVSPTCSQKIVGGIQKVAAARSQPIETIKKEDVQGLAAPEKTSKKPDKPIPCPRCESMDTKFCYFNNYNVNQPRHFCRKCQRYWTAGGSLRNVPIGAGRRKHKHPSLHQRHTGIADTMKVRSDSSDMASQIRCSGPISSTMAAIPSNQLPYIQQTRLHVPALDVCATPAVDNPYSLSTKSTVSSFGQESPLCKSMAATTLTMHKCAAMQNHGKFNDGEVIAPPDVKVEQQDNVLSEIEFSTQGSISNATNKHNDASTGAAVSVSNHASENLTTTHQVASGLVSQKGEKEVSTSSDGYEKQVKDTGFSAYGGPWQLGSSIPWNNPANAGAIPMLDGGAHALCSPNLRPTNGAAPGGLWASHPWPLMYPPAMCPPPLDWASSWAAMQWGPAAAAAAAAMMQHSGLVNTMRKHRLESSSSDGCLWVPKTLRIDDPVDAARSSIWTTLGLEDRPASLPCGGAPNIFQGKSESKDTNEEYSTTPNRHSNPAAFSRSVVFNENS